MKIALLTANINGIDEVHAPVKQSAEYDFYYYSENNLPFPLPHLNARLKGKYFKTQTHRFLDHDVFIWMDASTEIINEDFIKTCVKELGNHHVLIEQHQQRESVYQELEYIIGEMKKGSPYLLKRYAREPFYKEYDFYKSEGLPKTFPLFQCSFFVRKNNGFTNNVFNQWWDYILRYSNFDQTQFSYVAWENELKIKTIEVENLFIRHKH